MENKKKEEKKLSSMKFYDNLIKLVVVQGFVRYFAVP